MGDSIRELREKFEAAWKERRDHASRSIATLDGILREFQPAIMGATDRKAKLRLVVSPQIVPRTEVSPPRFLLRGSILLIMGDIQIVIAELGNIERVTAAQAKTIRDAIVKYLTQDEIIHGLVAFAITNEYGHKLKSQQEVSSKRMAKLIEHQLEEYERTEGWRGLKDEDNTDEPDENAFQ